MDPKNQTNDIAMERSLQEDLLSIHDSLSEGEDMEPPAMLDQAVLNTARRELASGKRFRAGWVSAFATASIVVLALTIIVQQEQTQVPLEPVRTDSGQNGPVRVSPDRDAEPDSTESMMADELTDDATGTRRLRAIEATRQEQSANSSAAPSQARLVPQTGDEAAKAAPPSPAVRAGTELREPSDAHPETPAEQPSEPIIQDERYPEGDEDAAIAGQSNRLSTQVKEKLAEEERETVQKQARVSQQDSDPPGFDAEQWIEKLQELKQSGTVEQFKHELEAFRAAYPEYPLPPELTDSIR